MSEADRHVKKEYIGDYWVSTVFLGIDHNWGAGNPILFETMVFDNGRSETLLGGSEYHPTIDNYFQRYSTWEQAEDGHDAIVREIRKSTMILIQGDKN